jgi:uncharacterized protein YwgA
MGAGIRKPGMSSTAEPNAEDYVLALMGAEDSKDIKGTLMLVKLAFIAAKEIVPKADPIFQFYPFDFGPYSKVLAQTVNQMIEHGLVESSGSTGTSGNQRTEYRLTGLGKERAHRTLETLDTGAAQRLVKLRKAGDQLGYQGILRYVYTKYPEYASASKILEQVIGTHDE